MGINYVMGGHVSDLPCRDFVEKSSAEEKGNYNLQSLQSYAEPYPVQSRALWHERGSFRR
jgi:hypothetical protein